MAPGWGLLRELIGARALPGADTTGNPRSPAPPASSQALQFPRTTNEQPVPRGVLRCPILQRGRPHVAVVSLVSLGHDVQEVAMELRGAVAQLIGLHGRAPLRPEPRDRKRLGPAAPGLADRERMIGAISNGDRVRDIRLRAGSGTGQLGLGSERLRPEERQSEREEACTHLILLVVLGREGVLRHLASSPANAPRW